MVPPRATRPFFSVIIPTKNRSVQAKYSIESVLRQTFGDYEIIICDNDDTDDTFELLKSINDERVRYFKTGGGLSMPDNWEFGFARSNGHFVYILSDRCMLKSYTLEFARDTIERLRCNVCVAAYQHVDAQFQISTSSDLVRYPRIESVHNSALFGKFLSGGYIDYQDYLPRGMNSFVSSSLLDRIRSTTGGRVCPPVAPDFTFAFLVLAHGEETVLINKPLYLWGWHALSNGYSVLHGGATGRRFYRDLGIVEADLSANVPIKTVGIHNSVCNDFQTLKKRYPEQFSAYQLDLFSYFTSCRCEIEECFSPGDPLLDIKLSAWERAVDKLPQDLAIRARDAVRAAQTVRGEPDRLLRPAQHAKRIARHFLGERRWWRARRVARGMIAQIDVARSRRARSLTTDPISALERIEADEALDG